MTEHYDGDHEYCEQCGDCILFDVPHVCSQEALARMKEIDGIIADARKNSIPMTPNMTEAELKQELYDLIADSVQELPEGAEPSPGSIVIGSCMSETEIQQFIKYIPTRKREPKMKASWQRIFTFAQYVGGYVANSQQIPGWLQLHPEETKYNVGVKRVLDQVPKLQQIFQQKRADIEMAHCATMHARAGDPESPKIIVRGEKGELCFTVEGDKAKQKAIEALIDVADMEVEPYYVELNEIPKLSAAEIEIFQGFVISPEQVESLKEKEAVSGNGHISESPVAAEATA